MGRHWIVDRLQNRKLQLSLKFTNQCRYEALTPKNWAQSDTLLLTAHDEWTTWDDKSHEFDRTVSFAINASRKASIESIHEDKKQ
jgi:hypothetical protein